MSAHPNQIDWEATPDAGSSLQEGNRVLESIARQEALHALLAFSGLHQQIHNRRTGSGARGDRDLFETERFILDEVLQLICDRAQTVSRADGILVALRENADAGRATAGLDVLCRASSGPLAVQRGVRLIGESEFLRECLESGRILRADDCESDARVELDFARVMGAASTVMVPLRGRREQVGVLQAFSIRKRAFSDHDVRCFDLFSELVLSAMRPEDQDRRIQWLTDVANDVLQAKPATAVAVAEEARPVVAVAPVATPVLETSVAAASIAEAGVVSSAATVQVEPAAAPAAETVAVVSGGVTEGAPVREQVSENGTLAPIAIPAEIVELPEVAAGKQPVEEEARECQRLWKEEISDSAERSDDDAEVAPLLARYMPPRTSGSGLSVVIGLVAVALLFSAGAWWGMQLHGKAANKVVATKAESSPQSVTTPPAPAASVLSPAISDNLMSPATSGEAPMVPVAANKLAALPKVTGVRHWSSSMGSTVVIDLEDEVPYEVHRLMSPERIYFDLHDTVLAAELDGKTMDVGGASLSRVRVAQPVAGVTRVVLDTKDGSNFSVSMESSPYRLVVELRGNDKNLTVERINAKPAVTPTAPEVSAKASGQPMPARTGKFRIVLDAGHGGWDLGTVGRQGLLEKDLVLDVAQRLGKLLQTRLGSDVLYTRTADNYLPLDERADYANQTQADLFVSVHANYSSSAAARGVETYYTNVFSAPGSRESDKQGSGAKVTPVSLSSGGLHDKIEESRRLAASVQRALYATLAARSPDIRNRGIKDSAFAVLTGTVMPAILTEISFVSSPADEHNLQSAAYRQQIAEALYQGIARYRQSSPGARVAQLQTAAAQR